MEQSISDRYRIESGRLFGGEDGEEKRPDLELLAPSIQAGATKTFQGFESPHSSAKLALAEGWGWKRI